MKSSRIDGIPVAPDETIDDFLDGGFRLIQSRTGYRFSIDALLLSSFVTVRKGDRIIDLGTGCGVIPLMILSTRPVKSAFGLEIQQTLASQAARNARLNNLGRKMGTVRGDIRHLPFCDGWADVVTCNPPYRKKDSGRINPDPERAVARHEIHVSTDDILGAARRLLKAKGRLAMIYPATRMVDLLVRMRRFQLEPKRLQTVHPDLHSEGRRVLVEASKGGRPGLKILAPILDQGDYSIPNRA
jgi:tRNA1Val (adenine37-N6)-methyltransferase